MKNYTNNKEGFKFYGGNAGHKLSIIEEGEFWILKFPKNTKNLQNVNMSYTTAPISEYIGSKIYEELGFPVHETKLGSYDGKIVVACKDFNKTDKQFYEIHQIKNSYLKNKEDIRESLSNPTSRDKADLETLLFTLENQSILNNLKSKERFWDMFAVDCFINNNDRHNGNWGVLISIEGDYELAPIYDNGASFFSKHDINKIEGILKNSEKLNQIIQNGLTPYIYNDEKVDSVKTIKKLSLNKGENPKIEKELVKSIVRNVPKIDLEKINKIIDEIPEEFEGIKVIPQIQKEFYKKYLEERYEKVLLPALEKAKEIKKRKEKNSEKER